MNNMWGGVPQGSSPRHLCNQASIGGRLAIQPISKSEISEWFMSNPNGFFIIVKL